MGYGNSGGASVSSMVRGMVGAQALDQAQDRSANLGLTARQALLGWRWAHYTCTVYSSRRVDHNGNEAHDPVEHELLAQAAVVPEGFQDLGGAMDEVAPLNQRRPATPYYLGRAIVGRFTGLLFSQGRTPKINVPGDKDTEDWLNAFVKATRLWSRMRLARRFGGACGSVGIGFKFVHGKPFIEVFDPRWSTPTFSNRETNQLKKFEVRFQFFEECENEDTGETEQVAFWYRRLITPTSDTIWPKVEVGEGDEPDWKSIPKQEREHKLGFVPVVWIQNKEVPDDLDGESDIHGCEPTLDAMNQLGSEAFRGTVFNCDPTLVTTSDDENPERVRKGSKYSLSFEKGGGASYLELSGSGPKAAMDLRAQLRTEVLEISQCVLDTNFGGPARTESEVTQNYSAMLEAADDLREQYGEMGVKPLLEMVLKAVRKLAKPQAAQREDGSEHQTTAVVRLPPKVEQDEDGSVEVTPRKLGQGQEIELKWGPYMEPGLDEAKQAAEAATAAKNGGLIDQETASRYAAPYFGVEDVAGVAKKAAEEAKASKDEMGGMFGAGGFGG